MEEKKAILCVGENGPDRQEKKILPLAGENRDFNTVNQCSRISIESNTSTAQAVTAQLLT